MRRLLKGLAALTILLVLAIAAPILVIETACQGTPLPQAQAKYITAPTDHRPEARTYLTYPEWHIVYAYEGYAEVLKTGAPHSFPYVNAVTGFWTSLCALTQKADALGPAGFQAKSTIYTIAASFTLEMAGKAVYEETIGRIAALFGTSPQDTIEANMAADYAQFLQQTPWYKFDFDGWTNTLRQAPTPNFRAHERRLALTLEWQAKAAYARLIAKAAAGVGADKLTMKIAIKGGKPTSLPNVNILSTEKDVTILEVPRYRVFTQLVQTLALQGGTLHEIAGNDDILVSVIIPNGDFTPAHDHILISRTPRVGFTSDRALLAVKVPQLHQIFTSYPDRAITPEHIYDY